jgi:hypothetical protein
MAPVTRLSKTEIAKSYIVKDRQYSSGFMEDATEALENYLKDHDYSSENWFGANKSIRYREGILEHGEKIAVAGKAIWKKKKDFAFSVPGTSILYIGPEDDQTPVHLSDDLATITETN